MKLNSINNTSFGMACKITPVLKGTLEKLAPVTSNVKKISNIETAYKALDAMPQNFLMDLSKRNPNKVAVILASAGESVKCGEFGGKFSPEKIVRKVCKAIADHEVAKAVEKTIEESINSTVGKFRL